MRPPEHLYDRVAGNRRLSWLLITVAAALLAVTGYFVGILWLGDPFIGTTIALVFSAVTSLVSYFQGDRIVLALMGARPADLQRDRVLVNVVEEMSIASGLPVPKVYVIDSPASNAFATGRDPRHASVAVTTGLMEILDRDELQGVIGHEMSHVRHYDILYGTLMAVMVGTIAILCDSCRRSWRYGGRLGRRRGGAAGIVLLVGLILAIVAPIVAKLIQLAMSRRREYLADLGGAELTRNPEALARALGKIAGDPDPLDVSNRGAQHLFIANPLRGEAALAEWFSTHPPIRERVRILREMAHAPKIV